MSRINGLHSSLARAAHGPIAALRHLQRHWEPVGEYFHAFANAPADLLRRWSARNTRVLRAQLGRPGGDVSSHFGFLLTGLLPPELHANLVRLASGYYALRDTSAVGKELRKRVLDPRRRSRFEKRTRQAASALGLKIKIERPHSRGLSRAGSGVGRPAAAEVNAGHAGGHGLWYQRPTVPARAHRATSPALAAGACGQEEHDDDAKSIEIYTDGSGSVDNDRAGAAAVLFTGQHGSARPIARCTLHGVARPTNNRAEACAVLLAVAAPRNWHPEKLILKVKSDSMGSINNLHDFFCARTQTQRTRNPARAFAVAIHRIAKINGYKLSLQHVKGHVDGDSADAIGNRAADAAARAAVQELNHKDPASGISVTDADGPVTVHTAPDHQAGANLHVTGCIRDFVKTEHARTAMTAARAGRQGEVLRHTNISALQQLGRAASASPPAVQVFLFRVVSTTLPVFDQLLRDYSGERLLTRSQQAKLQKRWTGRAWRSTRAMRRQPNGTLSGECVLCLSGETETAAHFMACNGQWAGDRQETWCLAVATVLGRHGLTDDAARAAGTMWRDLTESHWSHALGFYPQALMNRTVKRLEMRPIKANRHQKDLRIAMLETGAAFWARREEELLIAVNRRHSSVRTTSRDV
jgi:ribonuclease HI